MQTNLQTFLNVFNVFLEDFTLQFFICDILWAFIHFIKKKKNKFNLLITYVPSNQNHNIFELFWLTQFLSLNKYIDLNFNLI